MSDKDITRVAVADVQRMSKDSSNVLILDPRSSESFAAGHLPGAVNVPIEQIPSAKGSLRPDLANPKYIVVYGDNPGDGYAVAATKRLLRAGQSGARLFSGGLAEWKSAGLTIANSPAATPTNPAPAPK